MPSCIKTLIFFYKGAGGQIPCIPENLESFDLNQFFFQVGKELGLRSRQISCWLKKRGRG